MFAENVRADTRIAANIAKLPSLDAPSIVAKKAFTDLRLQKGHHDEPPEPNDRNHKPKALPGRNYKRPVWLLRVTYP
jgi:hypothetical protein